MYVTFLVLFIGISYGLWWRGKYHQQLNFLINLLPQCLKFEEVVGQFNHRFNYQIKLTGEGEIDLCSAQSRLEKQGAKLIHSFAPAFNALYLSKEKAENGAKLSALGEMAAGIAHEINNPLAIVHGLSQMINLKIQESQANNKPLDLAFLNKAATNISDTVGRMDKIVNGLRYFVKDDSRSPLVVTPLQEILDNVQVLSIDKCKKNGVKVEIINSLKLDECMYCKPMQISQVLINLINNSFDAVQTQPTKWIRVSCSGTPKQVIFTVQDSGPGIPLKIQDQILKPFFTNKLTTKTSGTGLGLSIAKRIIDQHGGEIKLLPSESHTTFQFSIPRTGP